MKIIKSHKMQTALEELVNSATHGMGAVLSIIGLIVLSMDAIASNNPWKIVSSILFGTSLLLMYLASTFYHSAKKPALKKLFKIIDHSAIYLLIAGSYTPFLLVTLHGIWAWSLFFVIWTLAISGIVFKIFFVYKVPRMSVFVYLLMGWLSILVIKPIYLHLPHAGLSWIVAGGLCYTIGVIFYVWKRLFFSHAIWHLFVLAGSACHFDAVLNYVVLAP